MKHILFFCLVLLSAKAYAQPTLTAAANNPLAGDNYAVYPCNTAGVAQGAAGAAVTWDFHTLTSTGTISYDFVSCASTPYCDSFPGSTMAAQIVVGSATNYGYFLANTSVLETLGNYYTSAGLQYYYKPDVQHIYPVVYNSSFRDTDISYSSGSINYSIEYDSNKVDGYGTLILPSGTFTNVLRQHIITVQYDSIPGTGVNYSATSEYYDWFAPGYHLILLQVVLDSSSGTGLSVSSVVYTARPSTGIALVNDNDASLQVSPNPASGVLNIKFTTADKENTAITLSDITGKIVGNINPAEISQGANDIQFPVADLPAGLYLLHLADRTHNITKKFVVARF